MQSLLAKLLSARRPPWSKCSRSPVKCWANQSPSCTLLSSSKRVTSLSKSSPLASGTWLTEPRMTNSRKSSLTWVKKCRGTLTSCACAMRTGSMASTATGSSRASVSSVFRFLCGTHSMVTETPSSMSPSLLHASNFQLIHPPMFPPVTQKLSVESPADSRVKSMSWTRGQPRA